jgi:hypothetical protein
MKNASSARFCAALLAAPDILHGSYRKISAISRFIAKLAYPSDRRSSTITKNLIRVKRFLRLLTKYIHYLLKIAKIIFSSELDNRSNPFVLSPRISSPSRLSVCFDGKGRKNEAPPNTTHMAE